MKITLLAVLVLSLSSVFAQNLKNTEWIQVKVERKDGSRILDHLGTERSIAKYIFNEKTVSLFVNNSYAETFPYTIKNKILTVGKYNNFSIDTLDSEILVLTQISQNAITDDKIIRRIFVSNHSIYQYLLENESLEIINDSIIVSNNQFAPVNMESIDKLFLSEFDSHNFNKKIYGSYILNSKGSIEGVQFTNNKQFTQPEIEKFVDILKKLNGSWLMPETKKAYKYKINFDIEFTYHEPLSGVKFSYIYTLNVHDSIQSINLKEIKEADNFFNNGNDYISKEKYDKAIIQFIKCLAIDSIYVDAYYNLAYCYQKLGYKDQACEIWLKLKNLGQKQGEYLYEESCNQIITK